MTDPTRAGVSPVFIFMLTHGDVTVPDATRVYDDLRDTALEWVGFKDIGATPEELHGLTERIHADGRRAVLEIVSLDEASEVRSVKTGIDIGVDLLMGGTHHAAVLPLTKGRDVRYFPFPGQVVGHPSVLGGTESDIAVHAAQLASTPGVHGLDLLAYRYAGDVPALVRRVMASVQVPVVCAGSIDSLARVRDVCELGVWGFTIGSAIFDGEIVPGATISEQVQSVIATLETASPTRS